MAATKVIPALSHSVAGPLGVMHLPRLWLKAVLDAAGCLAEEWNSGYRGVDKVLIDDLQIDAERLFSFLRTRPTYQRCEEWVIVNVANLSPDKIASHNAKIVGYRMSERFGAPRRSELGLEETDIWGAVILNDLDDWNCLREFSISDGSAEPIVPLVSSRSSGLLGLQHLPRLWTKAVLDGVGRLTPNRRSFDPGGADEHALFDLGIDAALAQNYLRTERPTYMEFETWVQRNAKHLNSEIVAANNAREWETKDDIADWDSVHAQITRWLSVT